MKQQITCCYGCQNRVLGCHATCEEYQQQSKARADEKQFVRDMKAKNDITFPVSPGKLKNFKTS